MGRSRTRLLLTTAAIGVAGGIAFIVNGLISGTVSAAAPFAYGATLGPYFLPGAIAILLLRRPGVGLLAAVISGLVVAPFTSISFRAIGAVLLIGALQELPYALTLYRRRPVWLLYLGTLISGVVFAVVFYIAFDVASLAPWAQIVSPIASIGSPLIFTAIAHSIASGVERTGVTRGLSPAPGRPRAHTTPPER